MKLLIAIVGIVITTGLLWLSIGIDSKKPLEFQINCNVDNTKCKVSGESTENYYGLMAINVCPMGNCFNQTINRGNCTTNKINDMSFVYPDGTIRYSELGDMQVKYSYEVICYSIETLKLLEFWK